MFYNLMALTVSGDLFPFSLRDGPCPLSEETFFLSNRPGTPILRYSVILRNMPNTNIYDGDIIEYRSKEYIVKYHRGFNCIANDGEVINLPETNYTIKGNIYKNNEMAKVPLPKYKIGKNYYCTIRKFYGANKAKGILVNDRNIGYAAFKDIFQYAGISNNKQKLYFTKNEVELVKGRILTIN